MSLKGSHFEAVNIESTTSRIVSYRNVSYSIKGRKSPRVFVYLLNVLFIVACLCCLPVCSQRGAYHLEMLARQIRM